MVGSGSKSIDSRSKELVFSFFSSVSSAYRIVGLYDTGIIG